MKNSFRSATSCCLILFLISLLALAGCESPGSVGGDIGEPKADVVIDTLEVDSLSSRTLNYYSGGFSHFSAGQYNDPLLGSIKATGLIKPSLPGVSDSLTTNANILMRVILDSQTYGDTLATQSFDIYEVSELWRGKAFKLQDTVGLQDSNGPLTSFTVTDQDSIDVPLPSDWVDQYRNYAISNEDSTYRVEQFGLALVPSNSNKIIAPNTSNTRFVIQNPEADTFSVSAGQWAYMLARNNSSQVQNSLSWHSTDERILSFDLNLSEEVETRPADISKAELVLYQNNERMESSLNSESSSVERPEETTAQLYLVEPGQLPANITPGTPIANGQYSSDDGAYHFNVTTALQNILANGIPEGQEFVVTLANNGVVKSSVIYTEQASEEKRPKLIITSLKNKNNSN